MEKVSVTAAFHSFCVPIAEKYGLQESIFLSNLCYWITQNIANKKHYNDGRFWTYNSYDAFSKLLPYFNKKQIEYLIKKLRDKKLIYISNYNQTSYDRTCWYAVSDEILSLYMGKSFSQNCDEENEDLITEKKDNSCEQSLSENQDMHIRKLGNAYPDSKKPMSQNSDMDNTKSGDPLPRNYPTIPYLNHLKTNSSPSPKQKNNSKNEYVLDSECFANSFFEIDNRLIFSEKFYQEAFIFMKKHNLQRDYQLWIYKYVMEFKPRNVASLYFSLFCKQENLQRFFARDRKKDTEIILVKIKCPVCECEFESQSDNTYCPQCDFLCKNHTVDNKSYQENIQTYRKILLLPEDQKKKYLQERSNAFKFPFDNGIPPTQVLKDIDEKYFVDTEGV